MVHTHLRRLLAASTFTSLVVLSLATSPVLGGDTRAIYVGDPGGAADTVTGFGPLDFSATRAGNNTFVDVEVRNDGGNTINQVRLLGGAAADAAPVNPLFPAPARPSLPSGASYLAAYRDGSPACSFTSLSLTCEIGQLVAHTSVVYRIVLDTGTASPTAAPWFGAYVAEGNSTGTNQDNFYAQGPFDIINPICDGSPTNNRDANYFLSTESVDLSTCTSSQLGKLKSLDVVGSTGSYGELKILQSQTCLPNYACFGKDVAATVLDGEPVPGGVQWDITWYDTRSLSGVIHFWDSYIAGDTDTDGAGPDQNNGDDYTLIPFTKKFQCNGTTRTSDCWVITVASKPNVTPLSFRAVFVTPDNGKGSGYF